jgi:hypothetical protein
MDESTLVSVKKLMGMFLGGCRREVVATRASWRAWCHVDKAFRRGWRWLLGYGRCCLSESICLWRVLLARFFGWSWRGGGMRHVKGSAAPGASLGGCSRRGMEPVRQKCEQRGAPTASRAVRPRANCRWAIRRGLGEVRPALRISHAGRAGALLASARKQKSRPRAADFFVSWRKRCQPFT